MKKIGLGILFILAIFSTFNCLEESAPVAETPLMVLATCSKACNDSATSSFTGAGSVAPYTYSVICVDQSNVTVAAGTTENLVFNVGTSTTITCTHVATSSCGDVLTGINTFNVSPCCDCQIVPQPSLFICQGVNSTITAETVNCPGVSYCWIPDPPFGCAFGTGQSVTFGCGCGSNPCPVSGTIELLVTDSNGCTDSYDFPYTCNTCTSCSVTANVIGDNDICAGETNVLTATGSTNGTTTYNWAASGGGTISGGTTGSQISATTTGTYCVTITETQGTPASTCSDTDCFTIVAGNCGPNCNMTVAVNQSGCQVIASPQNGTPSYSYNWSSGNTTQSFTATDGFYVVTVTDSQACTAVGSITVSGCAAPPVCDCTLSLAFNASTCELTPSLSGANCSNYTGDVGILDYGSNNGTCTNGNSTAGTTAIGVPFTVSDDGDFKGIMTGANGCPAITSNCVQTTGCIACPTITATFTTTNTTCNSDNSLDGAVFLASATGTAPWTLSGFPSGPFSVGQQLANNLSAGSYSGTITDSNGCTGSYSFTIGDDDACCPCADTSIAIDLSPYFGLGIDIMTMITTMDVVSCDGTVVSIGTSSSSCGNDDALIEDNVTCPYPTNPQYELTISEMMTELMNCGVSACGTLSYNAATQTIEYSGACDCVNEIKVVVRTFQHDCTSGVAVLIGSSAATLLEYAGGSNQACCE